MKKKEQLAEILHYVETIRDQDGNAVIDVNLSDVELYDPLSAETNRDLNGGVYEFIDAQTNVIPAQIPLKIRFHGDVPEEEQDAIRTVMHRHYTLKSLDLSWDVAANLRKMLILTVLGVALLALYFYFSYTSDLFFAEILSIIGSFSLWEAADALLLERPRLRRERQNIEQNINEIVEFVPLKG